MPSNWDWISKWATYQPDAVALIDGESGERWSYERLLSDAKKTAYILAKQYEVQAGDRVAVLAMNRIETVILFLATQRIGAILVPLNFRLSTIELEDVVIDAGPKLLIVDDSFRAHLTSPKLKEMRTVLFERFIREWNSQPNEYAGFAAEKKSIAMILYTSGTTGRPKGVLITMEMMFWNAVNTIQSLDLTSQDSYVNYLPFFHTGGWHVLLTPLLFKGGTSVCLSKFDPEKVLELSSEYRCSLLFGVPTTLDRMAKSHAFQTMDIDTIRYAIVGGEPMPLRLIEMWHDQGIPIRQGFGMTEFGPNIFSLHHRDAIRKMGSIGRPNYFVEAEVRRKDGKPAAIGEVGELCLKGKMCTSGYWNRSAESKEALGDGWLKTGDLVRVDEEGYFFVVGRKKEMYISGGENVYPQEIEKVLQKHRMIDEVAVIGVPDADWGEAGEAFIVAKKVDIPQSLSEVELRDFCEAHLAKYKVPRKFRLVESLPKGDTGKILKRRLTTMAQ